MAAALMASQGTEEMDNAIEAVAKAIFEDDEDAGLEWLDERVYQDHYRSLAAAAIQAYNDFLDRHT